MAENKKISVDEAIDYLRENPDFFKENVNVLEHLNFQHDTPDGAVSLIQRQVELLRQHLAENRERLAELARNANHNESLLKRFQELSVSLASAENQNHAITILQRTICLGFGLNLLNLIVPEGEWADEAEEHVTKMSVEDFDNFTHSIFELPIYLGKAPAKLLEGLLSDKAELARSLAIIKLHIADYEAYLVIGSKDEHHFKNDMGTEFVTFIGEYLSAVLSRFHSSVTDIVSARETEAL